MKNFLKVLFCLLGLASFCAKKLPPTSPDRFAPSLRAVEPVDRLHIKLKFSEPVDPAAVTKNDFTIGSTDTHDSTALSIRGVSGGDQPDNLLIVTDPQKPIPYELTGAAADTAHNFTHFKRTFIGSSKPDTIPPRIVAIYPGASAVRARRNFTIRISFSEPLDTVPAPVWMILPPVLRNRIAPHWAPDQASIDFALTDTLGKDTTVYFVLAPTLTDLGSNHLIAPGFTFFTTDTALPASTVGGSIKYQAKPVRNAFIMFYKNDTARAAAISDLLGEFTIPVGAGEYRVRVFADTANLGTVQLQSEIPAFKTENKNFDLELLPPEKPLPLNELLQ